MLALLAATVAVVTERRPAARARGRGDRGGGRGRDRAHPRTATATARRAGADPRHRRRRRRQPRGARRPPGPARRRLADRRRRRPRPGARPLPLLLAPRAARVLYVGPDAAGVAAAALAEPTRTRVDVVESSRAIAAVEDAVAAVAPGSPSAARAAAATAAPPGARGRGSLRRWLADAGRGPWDLVVLDLRTPARAEVAALASVETLRALATRLPDDGVVVLWLPLWQVDGAAIASVADAARAAFPDVTLWRGDTSRRWGTLGVAASRAALRLDPDVLARRLAAAPGAPWPRATDVAALYVGDWPARADAAPTDDDHPRLAIASARTRAGDRALVARRLVDYYRDVLVALPRRRVYDAAGWDPDAALRRQLDAAGAAGE
ncbi:MAG: hypothetical protein H6708_14515 [Kofleriaceae bacterium]|nr:hypothetical protein [Kofleriaceae bacterium]